MLSESMRRKWTATVTLPLLVGSLVALGFPSCSGHGRKDWNVVFILVDTLRADHLSTYGYDRPTSPELDRFAQGAYLFPNTLSQAGCTFPSVNSILTSRHVQHFLGQPADRRMSIPDAIPTLAEVLAQEGYATAAVSASSVVRATPSKVNSFGGFDQGFDRFDEECLMLEADCVNARAFEILDSMEDPFFLYLHYWDPHDPYLPPPHHVRAFPDHHYSHRFVSQGNLWPIMLMLYKDGPHRELSPEDIAQLKTLYDEEIRYFDARLAELLDHLQAKGILDETLIVFASDHGDEQLEHGEIAHCRDQAYQTVLHTPILVRVPGQTGGVVEARAQNLDLMPTILDYLGIDGSALGMEGKSLRRAIETGQEVNRYLFAAQGQSRVVTDGRYKLLYSMETGERRLFDLLDDPGETRDLAAEQAPEADRLQEILFRWITHQEGAVGSEEAIERARETKKHLEAVGYL